MGFKELTVFQFSFRRLFSSSVSEPAILRINSSKMNSIDWKKRSETLHNTPPSYMAKLITRLVNMRVVKNMTKNGKIARFSSIVIAGNGNGGLGSGHAKHDSASEAVTKAGKLAVRNIQYFNRWQDRTLFHDDFAKYKATKLYVRPAPPSKLFINFYFW
jgi:ribosomal protein S5